MESWNNMRLPEVVVLSVFDRLSLLVSNHRMGPFLPVLSQVANQMNVEILPLLAESRPLLCLVSLPLRLHDALQHLTESNVAFVSVLPNPLSPIFEELNHFLLFMDHNLIILFWNIRGAGGIGFIETMLELIQHHPSILALMEPRISGTRVDQVCRLIGYDGVLRIDASGFLGGIWLLWKTADVIVIPVSLHSQQITVEVLRRGEEP